MKKKIILLRDWKSTDGTQFRAGDIIEVDAETYGELTTGTDPTANVYSGQRSASPVIVPAPQVPAPVVIDEKEIRAQATRAEQSRVTEIFTICEKHGMRDLASDFVSKATPIEDVRKAVLDKLAERSAPVGGLQVLKDGAQSFRDAAIDGILMRGGHVIAKPAEGAQSFRGMSLLRLAEESLRRSGIRVLPSDTRELVGMALGMRGAEVIAGSSSDFPLILSSVANKSLIIGYETAPTSYQYWAAVGSVNDFKSTNRIKFSEVGKLKLVPENGKYQEAKLSEKKESIQIGTYGRIWTMSRQAIINDDLDAFARVPMSFGMQARYLPNDLSIAVLLANAAMSDGNALYSDAHGNNSAETDRRLDTVAHAQAAAIYMYNLLAKQQSMVHAADAEGKRYLNLRPRVWLVAGTDEIIARQAVVSAGDANASTKDIVNPIASLSLQVVPDQNIKTADDDYKHFMFADPRLAPVVEVAFLQGNQQPYFERMEQTDADGTKWLIRLDCGAAAVDHVGSVREVGTDAG